jgi:hypothetical protein
MVKGKINNTSMAENMATTPPSLFGIDRRMAYIHRKYHSGLMWIGVTSGFAIKKFSGSAKSDGRNRTMVINPVIVIVYPRASLIE